MFRAKVRAVKTFLRSVLVAAASLSLAACVVHTNGGSTPPPPGDRPPAPDPMLTTDGQHFAASRTYQGECAPAGSRGGCYSVSLEPDGSYRHMLLDAPITGTYVIAGDKVNFTPASAAPPSSMTLSADRTHLDDYVYQPPVGQTPIVQ